MQYKDHSNPFQAIRELYYNLTDDQQDQILDITDSGDGVSWFNKIEINQFKKIVKKKRNVNEFLDLKRWFTLKLVG